MEKWDVYDINGCLTGKTKTRVDTWCNDEYHLGASVWIINSKHELLIQKRSASKKRFPSIWCSPGGSAHAGESSRQCCIREALEEVGIVVNANELILIQRFFFDNTIDDNYAVFMDFPIEQAIHQSEEVSEVKWASISEIKRLLLTGQFLLDDESDLNAITEFISQRINQTFK